MTNKGKLLVVSGPSGVGKDTIIKILTEQSEFAKLPSCTTRKPRPGELDGVHYHFLTEERFLELHRGGKLIDHVMISGFHYGLPFSDTVRALEAGRSVVLHVVATTALVLKRYFPEAVLVFVMAPSRESLVSRLRKRGMFENDIQIRLRDDPTPLHMTHFFDFVVVNHEGEEVPTARKILQFTKSIGSVSDTSITTNQSFSMFPSYFATKNQNKLKEASAILGCPIEHIDVDLFEPQGIDVADVVGIKAKDAFQKTGKLVLVEDTGLAVVSWNGLPGALIKWFMDSVGNEGIIKMLEGSKDRNALARTAVGFFDGTETHVAIGEIRGSIAETPRGSNGFGWDAIFIPEGFSKTFAEMSPEEKNGMSMRKIAFMNMKDNVSR